MNFALKGNSSLEKIANHIFPAMAILALKDDKIFIVGDCV